MLSRLSYYLSGVGLSLTSFRSEGAKFSQKVLREPPGSVQEAGRIQLRIRIASQIGGISTKNNRVFQVCKFDAVKLEDLIFYP